MPSDDLQDKRLRARLALEGDERRVKRERAEGEVAKLREQAMLAMEGAERRARRETKIKSEAEQLATEKKRQEEIERVRQMEKSRREAGLAKTQAVEEAGRQEQEQRQEKIRQTEAGIERLKQEGTTLNPLRTLKSDLAQAVERQHLSATTIAIKEAAGRRALAIARPTGFSGLEKLVIGLVTLLLIGGGVGAIILVINKQQGAGPPPAPALSGSAIILTETKKEIEIAALDSAALRRTLRNNLLATSTATGSVTGIYLTKLATSTTGLPTKALLPLRTVLEKIQLPAPDSLLRGLAEEFVLGSFAEAADRPGTPFILVKVKSLDRAFAAMLNWEPALLHDFAPLWGLEATDLKISTPVFVDKRLSNLDTRLLLDSAKQPVLIYTFFNNTNLLITTDEKTLTELVSRLRH